MIYCMLLYDVECIAQYINFFQNVDIYIICISMESTDLKRRPEIPNMAKNNKNTNEEFQLKNIHIYIGNGNNMLDICNCS